MGKEFVTIHEPDGGSHVLHVSQFVDHEPNKNRQIDNNTQEAQERNKLPRRLYLKDIPAERANKTSDVLNLRTKERYKFKEGTKITDVHVFAGKGCLKPFEKAQKYVDRYGGKVEDWQHCSGVAYIVNNSGLKVQKVEVHWVQDKDNKIREAFIKEVLNNDKSR